MKKVGRKLFGPSPKGNLRFLLKCLIYFQDSNDKEKVKFDMAIRKHMFCLTLSVNSFRLCALIVLYEFLSGRDIDVFTIQPE